MKKPFFARFLEAQELDSVVAGASKKNTRKYPSDDDECITLKWPSDDDDPTWEVE